MAIRRPSGPLPLGDALRGNQSVTVRPRTGRFRTVRSAELSPGSTLVPGGVFPTAAGRLGRRAFLPGFGARAGKLSQQPVRGLFPRQFAAAVRVLPSQIQGLTRPFGADSRARMNQDPEQRGVAVGASTAAGNAKREMLRKKKGGAKGLPRNLRGRVGDAIRAGKITGTGLLLPQP